MHVVAKLDFTIEDFEAMPDSKRFELVDGNLVELRSGTESDWVAGQLRGSMYDHNQNSRYGWILGPASFVISVSPEIVRRPDASFVRFGRFPNERLPRGFARLVPDIAIESICPCDLASEIQRKVLEYLAAGVQLVWVINAETRIAHIYRADGTVTLIHENDELSGEAVFPGFRCRLADILPPVPTAP
jgi:Uma2 family endonuclease